MAPKKDPNKPKGRMSAYAFFVQEKRADSKAKGEEVEFTAFSQQCAKQWKAIGIEDDAEKGPKKKYLALADADKVRYTREMANYVPPDGIGKKGRGAKKPKDPNKPKRAMWVTSSVGICYAAMYWIINQYCFGLHKKESLLQFFRSAFFFFAADKRPKLKVQNPGATVGEIAKQLGAAWKIMTAKQKEPYETQNKGDRVRYERQMAAFRRGEPLEEVQKTVDDDEEEFSEED